MRRRVNRLGNELVPRVRVDATFGCDRAHERIQKEERARDLPSAAVPGCGRAPILTREPCPGSGDKIGNRTQLLDRDSRFFRRVFECEAGIELEERFFEALE